MIQINIEDIVTMVCTKFVKQNKKLLETQYINNQGNWRNGYLNMTYKQRQKITNKLLDSFDNL